MAAIIGVLLWILVTAFVLSFFAGSAPRGIEKRMEDDDQRLYLSRIGTEWES